ncbi:uncharacterized protein DMAD_13070 [Drosophila madeirensis]|uniref:RNA-directed DNA polymerase n=1 Tax=Drosophila madeirensis TaxID=30013 RepID=A0AAU9FIZ3_DROMD
MLVLPTALDDVLLGLDFFAAIDAKLQVGGLLIPLSRSHHGTTEGHRPAKTRRDDACIREAVAISPAKTRRGDACIREAVAISPARTNQDDACIREAVAISPARTNQDDACIREAVVISPGRTRQGDACIREAVATSAWTTTRVRDDPGTCNREVTGGSASTTKERNDDACIREAVVTLAVRTRTTQDDACIREAVATAAWTTRSVRDDPGTCNREVTGGSASTTKERNDDACIREAVVTLAVRTRTTQDDACIREAVATAAWRTMSVRDDPGTCNREVTGGPSSTARTNPDDACIREAVVPSAETTMVREGPGTERDRTWRGALGPARLKATQRNPFRSRPEDLPVPLAVLASITDATLAGGDAQRDDAATMGSEAQPAVPSKLGPSSTEPIASWVQEFLEEELAKFDGLTGVSNIAEHVIVMRDDRPIKQRYYPRNPAMQGIIHAQVDELLRDGCIEPSKSPHSAPIVLVGKKTGETRMCVDFRQLNARSVPDAYPLPRINSILERLRNAKYISTLDLKSGYWQIPMAKASRECTAFTVPGRGLFQWRVMPFGLHSAPATFQRALDSVIGADMEPHAFAYLDDIIIIGTTLEEHVRNLREVLRRLRQANLRLNRKKCLFLQRRLVYLGHVVSKEGIHTDPEKIAAVQKLAAPTSVRELRRCLGLASWYRRFVPNFAAVVQPMSQLLRKGKKWTWETPQQQAFAQLKELLTEAPVLACPDFTSKFSLQTDASDYGLGGVLTQPSADGERVIAYVSRRLSRAEENYSATEKECLAIVWAIRKLRCYLEGYRFDVVTDHLALKWLNTIENPTGRIARWALELQQFQFDIHYRKGRQNVVADALSRQPLEALQTIIEEQNTCAWIRRRTQETLERPEKYPDYTLENGQLYRNVGQRPLEEDFIPWKLCVGKEQRQRVLQECHDQPSAGHLGIRKTTTRVCQRYYWPGIFRDVARYVRKCAVCQKFKTQQAKPAGKMLTRQASEPFATICADFVGPLPRSKQGNTVLLVFLDMFSKWVELIPLRRATATSLEKAFRDRILSRFGIPRKFICDNGTQFTSRCFKAYCKRAGMTLEYTAPYNPQQNPTERANRTIKTMIAQYIEGPHSTWDTLLPEISLAINSSVSDTTGFSPAFLVQGREPRLPGALYEEVTPGSGIVATDPETRAKQLYEVFQAARDNTQRASAEQARHYNLRRRDWRPTIGSLVLVKQHVLSKANDGFAAKLAPRYEGPYKVTKFVSPNIARVRHTETGQRRTAGVADLKAFQQHDDEEQQDSGDGEHPLDRNTDDQPG